jgi:hypothetical protein
MGSSTPLPRRCRGGAIVDQATADRDVIAETDTVPPSSRWRITASPVTLTDLAVSGAITPRLAQSPFLTAWHACRSWLERCEWTAMDSSAREDVQSVRSSVTDRATGGMMLAPFIVPGVAIPEEIRRTTDVTVSLTIAGISVTTSIGPVAHRAADPLLGVQTTAVSGAPAVTLAFERGLEWIPAGKPIARQLRLAIKSYSDRAQRFELKVVAPVGVRVDSLPSFVMLGPGQQRELFLHLRGTLPPGRYEFGVVGRSTGGEEFLEGFQTLRYAHIPPVNFTIARRSICSRSRSTPEPSRRCLRARRPRRRRRDAQAAFWRRALP